MRWRRLCGSRWAGPWNAELGKGANQLTTASKPSGDQQRLPEAALAWARIDDRPAGGTRIEIWAEPSELCAGWRGTAGEGENDVQRGTGEGVGRRGAKGERRRRGAARADQGGEKIGL